ncbi:MAG TPA: porin [Planctomycetota bacterium]|nr:porin [Planctomycetota bacterium]
MKSLSVIALGSACIPAIHAVSISDDVVKLGVGVRLQTRAQVADSDAANGDEFNVQNGGTGSNDPVDFSIRRARLMFTGSYGADWKFNATLQNDNVDNTGASNANRATAIRYAWVERAFKMDGDMAHLVKVGLDKPFFNAADVMSSSRMLFPTKPATDSATPSTMRPRGVGLSYKFAHPMFIIGADIQNNVTAKPATGFFGNAEAQDIDEGLFYSARAEFTPLFDAEWFDAKRSESYVGKEGHHLMIGLKYGANDEAIGGAATVSRTLTTTTGYGADVLFHWNQITFSGDYFAFNTEVEAANTPTTVVETDVDSQVISAQVGYAFPLGGDYVLEPALRYAIIDLDTDIDNVATNYSGVADAEHGLSGDEIEVGLNLYLDGHNNKLSLAYSMWNAEDGDADANVVRLQHQLNF